MARQNIIIGSKNLKHFENEICEIPGQFKYDTWTDYLSITSKYERSRNKRDISTALTIENHLKANAAMDAYALTDDPRENVMMFM
jgi:hypothetical protein